MSQIEFAPGVAADFDRILDPLVEQQVAEAADRIQDIIAAVNVLARSPLIGRPADGGKRELVIGRGSRGFIALYRFVAEIDTVFVLAVRSQKEAGYAGS
ncbi:MAG: plasmid stabilization protein [Methylibium sp. NZG]|nr:MAG: plasmid stabilization protein [Methylibium sp. NZG]